MSKPNGSLDFRSAQHLQVVLEYAADAYLLHDVSGNIVDANATACTLLGYEKEQLLAKNIFDVAIVADEPARQSWFSSANEQSVSIIESSCRKKADETFPAEFRLTGVVENNERYVVVFARDITRRKRSIEMLELTKMAVDHAANPIFWYRVADSRFVYVNSAACDYLGYTRDEILNMHLVDLNPSTTMEGFKERVNAMRQAPRTFDTEHRKKNGELVPVEVWAKTIEYGGEELVVSFVRDVSQRKKYEASLKDAKDKAERADKLKSAFLANMSHEIRTPLTGIIGFSEALLDRELPEDERVELTHTILRSGRHLYQVINDILDVSKIEADQLQVESIDVSPINVLFDINAIMSKRAQEKGIAFYIDYRFPLPKMIRSDPVRLKQILINIIGNAIKFTERGEVRVTASFETKDSTMVFVIKDSGIGMTEDELSRIFKPFAQADASTTRKYGGTGLGLNISSRLAKLLGGTVTCHSQKGMGSEFIVRIDAGKSNAIEWTNSVEQIIKTQETESKDLRSVIVSGKVLLAEDTVENQHLISMYIKRAGADVTVVDNGLQAFDAATSEQFDLILMDSQMPVMDGLEAIKKLREHGYNKPIVSITANAMKADMENCLAAGASDYLSKPIDVPRFREILKRYLPSKVRTEPTLVYPDDSFRDDPDFLVAVQSFVEQIPCYLKTMNDALQQKDWAGLKTVVHQLKGFGASVGYPELTTKAAAIDDLLRNNKNDAARIPAKNLIAYCEAIYTSRKELK